MTDNVSSLPGPEKRIFLNLDELERDSEDVKEPFTFVLAGKTVTLNDPADQDWQELTTLEDEYAFIKLVMNDEDRGHFLSQKLPAWKMKTVMTQFREHYGVLDPGNVDG